MGLSEIRELIKPLINEIDIKQLNGKVVALDAFNTIYQFLTAIRQPDGRPLMNSKGEITSHLSGILYRTKNLLENGIRPIYVFDGKHPEFKRKEMEHREKIKQEMEKKYKKALELGIKSDLKKYAQGTAKITPKIIEDSKRLLDAMGIPWIQAPSEGEAQAAHLVKNNIADYTGSQDYDSLLFGSPRVVRNLTITGKKKIRGVEVDIKPETVELKDVLDYLSISYDKLIWLALIIGTDYNPEGIKGIGVKTAYELVKSAKNPEKLFNYLQWEKYYPDVDWEDLIEFFKNPPVINVSKEDVKWRDPNEDEILRILVDDNDFSEDRVKKAIESIKNSIRKGTQKSILSFFK